METICLFVDVPICAFRPNWSREYQDTFPFPPPATVFGMLLSLAGVDWMEKNDYAGIRLALALEGEPEKTRVFRKLRRVPQANRNADPLTSRRPDWQDLLLWLKLWVWLNDGDSGYSLVDRVRHSLDRRGRSVLKRYGGLSLGESSHLVNEIILKSPKDKFGRFLASNNQGFYSLPVWVNHPRCGKGRTKLMRFEIIELEPLRVPDKEERKWIPIIQ